MSVQPTLLKEEIKTISEGLTLEELGLTIPSGLAEMGWFPGDKINKLYPDSDKKYSYTIFKDVIEHGFFDFALEIIKTADRPDKLGFDPNFPVFVYQQPPGDVEWISRSNSSKAYELLDVIRKTPNPCSPLCWVIERHSEALFAGLDQIVDALINRGALLCPDEFEKYHKNKGIPSINCPDCNAYKSHELRKQCTHGGYAFWKIVKGRNRFIFDTYKNDIDDYFATTPMMHRIFAEYWIQTEPMIYNDADINTVENFKVKINGELPIGIRIDLPKQIFDIIFSYLSPYLIKLQEEKFRPNLRSSLEKYYIPLRHKRDIEFREKILKIRAEERIENEKRQQIKEARAKKDREAKAKVEQATAQPQAMAQALPIAQVPKESKAHAEMVRTITQDRNVVFEIVKEPIMEKDSSLRAEMVALRTEVGSLRSEMNALRGAITPLTLQFSALIRNFEALNKILQNQGSSESRSAKPS